nr:hypothetical protein [Flammeovirgaceae bacterium]
MENKICFIDTCIISQAISDKNIFSCLVKFIIDNNCLCGITDKSLSELHKSPKLFEEFYLYLN